MVIVRAHPPEVSWGCLPWPAGHITPAVRLFSTTNSREQDGPIACWPGMTGIGPAEEWRARALRARETGQRGARNAHACAARVSGRRSGSPARQSAGATSRRDGQDPPAASRTAAPCAAPGRSAHGGRGSGRASEPRQNCLICISMGPLTCTRWIIHYRPYARRARSQGPDEQELLTSKNS
jgi:hypothetical protein